MTHFDTRFSVLLLPLALLAACSPAGVVSGVAKTATAVSEERSFGEIVDDTGIYTEINHYYLQTDINDLLPNVRVLVHRGRVLLVGNVEKHETAQKAVELAWQASGVKEVINELRLKNTGDALKNRAQDEWIQTQIDSRLLFDNTIRSTNYKVDVVNAVVYVLGIAEDEGELNRAFGTMRTTKGVKRVVSHVRMREQQVDASMNNPG